MIKKFVLWTYITLIFSSIVMADTNSGFGMMGMGTFGFSLIGIIYFALISFVFSLIFWYTYVLVVKNKEKARKR